MEIASIVGLIANNGLLYSYSNKNVQDSIRTLKGGGQVSRASFGFEI